MVRRLQFLRRLLTSDNGLVKGIKPSSSGGRCHFIVEELMVWSLASPLEPTELNVRCATLS
eukprot:3233062-Amphidinium_carterae.2